MSFVGADRVPQGRSRRPSSTPCGNCGAVPTADVEFMDKQGALTLTHQGPHCRDCGLAVFRSATASTLSSGWWGPVSFFTTPFVVAANIVERRSVARLSAPRMPTEGRDPMTTGRPLWMRWQIIGALVPFAVAAAVIGAVYGYNGHERQKVNSNIGRCVQSSIADDAVVGTAKMVDCSEPHNGRITGFYNGTCPPGYAVIMVPGDRTSNTSYCVQPTGP